MTSICPMGNLCHPFNGEEKNMLKLFFTERFQVQTQPIKRPHPKRTGFSLNHHFSMVRYGYLLFFLKDANRSFFLGTKSRTTTKLPGIAVRIFGWSQLQPSLFFRLPGASASKRVNLCHLKRIDFSGRTFGKNVQHILRIKPITNNIIKNKSII